MTRHVVRAVSGSVPGDMPLRMMVGGVTAAHMGATATHVRMTSAHVGMTTTHMRLTAATRADRAAMSTMVVIFRQCGRSRCQRERECAKD